MAKEKPLQKYLADYLNYLEIEKGLSQKTQENYNRFLNKFFYWLERTKQSSLKPSSLNRDILWQYKVFLSRHIDPRTGKTLKKSTQNYYLIALRSLLEFFVEIKIDSLSPSAVKLAKDKGDKQVKYLSLEQLEKLLLAPDTSAIAGLRDRAIMETLFSTGLRVAELIGLNRDQLKLSTQASEYEISIIGKGGRVRTVYFSRRAMESLKKYLDKRGDIDEALFINYKRGAGKTNAPRRLSAKSIENIVKKYIKIAGLPVMATPHTLRHSFATDLLAQGVDLRLVQEFLGHQNIATTQIYTHVTNKQLRDVHKKMHGGKDLRE